MPHALAELHAPFPALLSLQAMLRYIPILLQHNELTVAPGPDMTHPCSDLAAVTQLLSLDARQSRNGRQGALRRNALLVQWSENEV